MSKHEEESGDTNPRLIEAKIEHFKALTKLTEEQAEKEKHIAAQHRMAVEEGKKLAREQETSNLQNRFYDFVGPVTMSATETAMQVLSRWRRQNNDPITIRISSPGGNVLDGLALYDFLLGLRKANIEVRIVVLGMAASMAAILLQAGTVRVVGPNSRILIHEVGSEGIGGKLSDLQEATEFFKTLNEHVYQILAERSKLSVAEISRRAKKKDFWLTAKDIVEKGFADEVGFE